MKFKESCLAEMLRYPAKCYRMGFYGFLLRLPMILGVLTVGVFMAVIADFAFNPHPGE